MLRIIMGHTYESLAKQPHDNSKIFLVLILFSGFIAKFSSFILTIFSWLKRNSAVNFIY